MPKASNSKNLGMHKTDFKDTLLDQNYARGEAQTCDTMWTISSDQDQAISGTRINTTTTFIGVTTSLPTIPVESQTKQSSKAGGYIKSIYSIVYGKWKLMSKLI